jgi:hypothetical protein
VPSNRITPPVGLDQAQDAAPGGGLAAAGFANQRQRLARMQGERDRLDRVDPADGASQHAAGHVEAGGQVGDFQ